MGSGLGIALALWLGPPQTADAGPTPPFCDLAIRTESPSYAQLHEAVELRLPGIRLRVADGSADPACAGGLHGYVELRPITADAWELSLISADGRAWFRTVSAEPDQAARALASALANLVAAIEDAEAEPDAHDVVVPVELEEPEPEPEPEPEREPEPEPEPDPRAEPEPAALVLEIGPRLAGTFVVGLAPAAGLRGGGAGFGVDLRLPHGLAVGFDLRTITQARADLRLVRTRVALGVGWVVREGMFELPVLVSAMVEPWAVRAGGEPVPLGQPPMVGGGLRLAPSLAWTTGPVALRLGLGLGFELALEAAGGALTPAIAREPGAEPLLRAGGFEFSAGLELGVWIPVRAR